MILIAMCYQEPKLKSMICGAVQCDHLLTSAMICEKTLMHTGDSVNYSALSVGYACMIELKHDINSTIEFTWF
jgi:predicted Rdx family selenoprotein